MAIQASLGAYKHYLSPSLKRLSPTPIPVSDNPARAKGLKCLGKTAGRRRVSPIMCSYGNYTHAEPKQDGVILNHGPSDQRERPGLGRSRRWTWPMSVVPSLRSMLCVIGAGPMLTWRLRPCGRCINLNQLQTIRSADAGDPTRCRGPMVPTVVWTRSPSCRVCVTIGRMGRPWDGGRGRGATSARRSRPADIADAGGQLWPHLRRNPAACVSPAGDSAPTAGPVTAGGAGADRDSVPLLRRCVSIARQSALLRR